jgi:DNA-binding transcriptional ArsR family regulator
MAADEGNGRADRDPARDAAILISLRHPLRRRILKAMIAAEEPSSPRGIATELKEPLSNVSYHVRVLADQGTATLHDTEPVRGSVKHLYEPALDEEWALAALGLQEDNTRAADTAAEAATVPEDSR